MTYCPECGVEIEADPGDFEKGDVVECDECGAELEVTATSPLEFEAVDESWDDEDEDEDWD